jgi:hypothetical protein
MALLEGAKSPVCWITAMTGRSGPQVSDGTGTELSAPIDVRAPGRRATVHTAEQALKLIDNELPQEMAQLPRWTFARALLVEAILSKKSRDIKAATRQLRQALTNEKWLPASTGKSSPDNLA